MILLWGSGYDIAVAKAGAPIIYTRNGGIKTIETVNYSPSFKDQLFICSPEQKQDSVKELRCTGKWKNHKI